MSLGTIELAERVERGAAFLNETRPGWYEEINTGTLYIANSHRCVLGQLYGHYGDGLAELGFDFDAAAKHGFGFEKAGQNWRGLTELWVVKIEELCRAA